MLDRTKSTPTANSTATRIMPAVNAQVNRTVPHSGRVSGAVGVVVGVGALSAGCRGASYGRSRWTASCGSFSGRSWGASGDTRLIVISW